MGRKARFDYLKSCVKPTPLIELPIHIPNNNRIFAKMECDYNCNPNGNHYDRVYPWLLESSEIDGIPTPSGKILTPISPDTTHIVEVSTGNACISASWVCTKMGYDVTICVPENLPRKRLEFTRRYGAEIIEVERKDYVGGAVEKLFELITAVKYDKKGKRYTSLNHAFNPITTNRLSTIINESWEQTGKNIDIFVSTAGNGASTLGPSRLLKKYNPNAEIICWEQFRSGIAYDKQYQSYEKEFGIRPAELFNDLPQPKDNTRELLGNLGPGTPTPFIIQAYEENLIDDTFLVVDEEMLSVYEKKIKNQKDFAKKISKARKLIQWESPKKILEYNRFYVGNTSIGSVAVALNLAEKVKDKTIMVIFYDGRDKY